MKLLVLLSLLISVSAFAIECDCEVRVYAPMTASHEMKSYSLKIYQLEEYGSYSVKNQKACRIQCEKEFEKEMPVERLNASLIEYGQSLIRQKELGYNCTGLTTMKFPVRVKASLGQLGLGNVVDVVQVVNHEELCFNFAQ